MATISGLDWRTRHRSVGAKYATIAGLRFEPFAATLAVIKELTGIGGHLLRRLMAALWAGERRLQDHAESLPGK
jgi:hypothetical protein